MPRSSDGVDGLLQATTDLGRHLFGAAACSLALLEPDEEHIVFRAASGAGAAEVVGLRMPVSRGIAGWVVSSGQPIEVHDVRADPRFALDVAESTGYVPRSILAMPLETAAGTVGVVEVLDRTPMPGRDDMDLLAHLARPTGAAIELVNSVPQPAEEPDPARIVAQIGALGAEERRAAAGLLSEFMAYVERRGGPAGLV
jgi:GAF domain-containing protein